MDNISKKEFWLGIAVALIALAVAVFFEPAIKDGMLKNIQTYEQALRVDNDSKVFAYAQKTNVGNVLAFGDFEALQPQSIPELQGSYAVILKVKEHYTMHTRQNCSTDSKGNETCTTETYYSWDTVKRWHWESQDYSFLEVKFQAAKLELPEAQRIFLDDKTMSANLKGFYDQWNLYEQQFFGQPSGDDRYYFEALPLKFAGTMFVRFLNDEAVEPISGAAQIPIYASMTPAQVIQRKKDDLIVFDIGYYILSIALIGGLWYWLAYSKLDIE